MGNKFRWEEDSMGKLKVPAKALYRAQTQRAVENFPVSGRPMSADFICALALVKRCAAETNMELGLLNKKIGGAIVKAAREVSEGQHLEDFPVDVFQTGSGTSSNMNMNEVLATLAGEKSTMLISPNDHVNMGQSSNDVIPTVIHVSAVLKLRRQLLPALDYLAKTIEKKGKSLDKHIKTGRTHLCHASSPKPRNGGAGNANEKRHKPLACRRKKHVDVGTRRHRRRHRHQHRPPLCRIICPPTQKSDGCAFHPQQLLF